MLNNDGKDVMLDALADAITHYSLHTDAVGGGAGNEVTGGSPAYARQATGWGAAAGGSVADTSAPVFDVPDGTTIRRVGFRGHVSDAAPYYGDAPITEESFGAQGTYTLTSASITVNDPS